MRKTLSLLVTALVVVAVAGCGSNDDNASSSTSASSSDGGSLQGKTIKATLVVDATGVAAFAGEPVKVGVEYAVKQANASGELDGAKLELAVEDTGSKVPATAAATSKVASGDSAVEIFGVTSAGGLAAAPVAQKAKLPLIVVQAGAPGTVETGDYIFRTTAPQETYHELQAQLFQDKGYKRVGVILNSEVPTLVDLAKNDYAKWGDKYGYEIVSTENFTNSDTDFTSIVSKVLAKKPDVILDFGQGPQATAIITALRRAGYKGAIAGSGGLAGGILKSAGKAANGATYNVDFTADTPFAGGKKFAEEFEASEGKAPTNFMAEGYDAVRLIVEGIKASNGDVSREGLHKGLLAATEKGFVGATGNITFENRDARVPGLIVEWQDGKEKVVKQGEGD